MGLLSHKKHPRWFWIHETDLNVLWIHWILQSDNAIELCITEKVEKGKWRILTNSLQIIYGFFCLPRHIHERRLTKIYTYIFLRCVEENHQGIKDKSKNPYGNKIDRTQVEHLKQGYCQLVSYTCSNSYWCYKKDIPSTELQNTDNQGNITILMLLLTLQGTGPGAGGVWHSAPLLKSSKIILDPTWIYRSIQVFSYSSI